jgi:ethanolamine utilization protein EutP (predicted NTPase)
MQTADIDPTQAKRIAQEIGAVAYFETSALRRKGVDELFSYVAEYAVMKPIAKKGLSLRRFWSKM